jgi:hypothetical protein
MSLLGPRASSTWRREPSIRLQSTIEPSSCAEASVALSAVIARRSTRAVVGRNSRRWRR